MADRSRLSRLILPVAATVGGAANVAFGWALVRHDWATPDLAMVSAALVGLLLAGWATARALTARGVEAAHARWTAGTLLGTALPAAGLLAPTQGVTLALVASGLAIALSSRALPRRGAGFGLAIAGAVLACLPALLAGAAPPGRSLAALGYGALGAALGPRGGFLVFAPLIVALLASAPPRRARWLVTGMTMLVVALIGHRLLGAPAALGGVVSWLLAPLLLWTVVGGDRGPSRRSLAVAWVGCAVVAASGAWSLAIGSAASRSSLPVLDRGIFAVLPYEATVVAAPGEVEVPWAGETLRYLQAPAELGPGRLTLTPAQPRARLLLATPGPEWPVRLLIESNLSALTLTHRDWATTKRYPLVGAANGTRTLLALELAPGWRLHPLPPDGAGTPAGRDQALRRFDLSLEAPAGSHLPADARVDIRYLGGTATLAAAFAATAPGFALPTTAEAGSATWVDVPLRNDGRFVWDPEVRPGVILSYRLIPPPVGVRAAVDGTRSRLAAPIQLGAIVIQPLRIRWPDAPGRYWLVVDLALERLMWFEDAAGAPLVAGWVEVLPRRAGRTSS